MSGLSEIKGSAKRTQPKGMEVSEYTIKTLKQQAINAYFEHLVNTGQVSVYLGTEENDGMIEIQVRIRENLYV